MNGSMGPKVFQKDALRCPGFKKKKPLKASLGEFCNDYQDKINKNTIDMNQPKKTGWDKMEVMMKNPGAVDGNFLAEIPECSEVVITNGWSADMQNTPPLLKTPNGFKVIMHPNEQSEYQEMEENTRFRDFVKHKRQNNSQNVPQPEFTNSMEIQPPNYPNRLKQYMMPAVNSITYDKGMIEKINAAHMDHKLVGNTSQSNRNFYSTEEIDSSTLNSPLICLENNLKSLQANFKLDRESNEPM